MADNKDSGEQCTVDLTNGPASSGLSMMLQYLKPKSVTSTSCVTVNPTEAKKSEFGSASFAQESGDDDGAVEEPPSQRPLAQPMEGQGAILDPKWLLRSALWSTQELHNYTWLWSGDSALISILFARAPYWDDPHRAQITRFDRLDQNMPGAASSLALYAVLRCVRLGTEGEAHILQFAGTKRGLATIWLGQVWYFIPLEEMQLEELHREWSETSDLNNMAGN